MQQSPLATTKVLRGLRKMIGRTNQYIAVIYTSYNLGICNNKAESGLCFTKKDNREATHPLETLANILHGKYRSTIDLNRTRFLRLTINDTHRLTFLKCDSSDKKTPPQTKYKLSSKRPFPPLARITLQQESQPRSRLFMSMRMQERGRGQGRSSLWKKKKEEKSSPIPETLLLWACGVHNRWQREPSLRLALKLSTQAYHSHSPHTSGPSAQGGLSPSTPRRPLSSRCLRQAAGPGCKQWADIRSSRPLCFSPSLSSPAFSQTWVVIHNLKTFVFWEFESLGESGLLTGGSVLDAADSCILALVWIRMSEKTAP